MEKPLVSIVTPCYNGAEFLEDYFSSIIKQTYRNLEIVIVNDGSIDNSDEIITAYIPKIQSLNMKIIYIKKNNAGQMKAVQDGLKVFTGEYLTWPDVDDEMLPDYIKAKVDFFLAHPTTDLLISPSALHKILNKDKKIGIAWKRKFINSKGLMVRFIEDKDAGYMPGSYMLKTQAFLKEYPDRNIFCEIKAGVAVPLVFPFIYRGQVKYLNKVLYKYYLHPNNQHAINEERDINNLNILYKNVINHMCLSKNENQLIIQKIQVRSLQLILGYYFRKNDAENFNKIKKELITQNAYRVKDKIKGIILRNRLAYKLYFQRIKRK